MFDDLPVILGQGGEAAPQGDTAPPAGGQGQGQTTEAQDGSPQQGADGQGGGNQTGTNPGGGFLGFPLILLLIFGVMIIFMVTSQRREKKRKEQMQASLAKGAKVQTVGGILGTVVEVRDDEVVVKVDENANTRLRFSKNAIASTENADEKPAAELSK